MIFLAYISIQVWLTWLSEKPIVGYRKHWYACVLFSILGVLFIYWLLATHQ